MDKDEEEFEEVWKMEEWNYSDKFNFNLIIKRLCRWWWLESRRRLKDDTP